VDDEFSTLVPVQVQITPKRTVVEWVRTAGEAVPFTVTTQTLPLKVALDPTNMILKR